MKARVYLATTAGPVRIERLTRERAQQSAVCLGRTTKVLAVSADYDAFVRQPSGVIEREFGPMEPGAFRLDVDGPIDDGDSWQLGVFAAHMLAGDQALAGPGEPEDRAIWLTGAVHNDLAVGPVDHIPEKLRASRDAFAALAQEAVPVTLVLPPGGRAHAEAANLPGDIAVVEVASTKDLDAAIGIDSPPLTAGQRPASVVTGSRAPVPGGAWLLLVTIMFVLAAGAAAMLVLRDREALNLLAAQKGLPALAEELAKAEQAGWIRATAAGLLHRDLEEALPSPGEVELEIHERRAPEGQSCAAVHFGNVDAVLAPVAPGPSLASARGGVCGLAFSIVTDPAQTNVAVRFKVLSGKYVYGDSVLDPSSGALVFSGAASWTLDLPRRPDGPFLYRIELVASRNPVDARIIDLRGSPGMETAEDFAALGILYRTTEHRLER